MDKMKRRSPKFKLWLSEGTHDVIGEGGVSLLKAIDEFGSITAAAKKIGMSYRFAWNQIKEIEKTYNEFFYQAEFILNEKGKIVLIGNQDLIKKYSTKYKFKISGERSIYSGKREYKILVLSK